jgi:hypothetical protein
LERILWSISGTPNIKATHMTTVLPNGLGSDTQHLR